MSPLTLTAAVALLAAFLGFLGGSHHRGILADRDMADRAAVELRNAYTTVATALTGRVGEAPTTAPGSTASVGAELVLTDLLSGGDALLREAAAALDQSRIAGLACERSYDAAYAVISR